MRKCKNMLTVLIQNVFVGMINRKLLNIPFPMNHIITDQLALSLVNICLGNTLQILCKSLLCFAKIWKIGCSKVAKVWLVKFSIFCFKIVYLAQFSSDFHILDLKI